MALVMIQFTFPSNQSSDKALREGQILIFFAHERCCLNNLLIGAFIMPSLVVFLPSFVQGLAVIFLSPLLAVSGSPLCSDS